MSNAEYVVRQVIALNGGNVFAPISKGALRHLTLPRYEASGANGALFGFRNPWMVRCGDLRYLTDAGRRRLRKARSMRKP